MSKHTSNPLVHTDRQSRFKIHLSLICSLHQKSFNFSFCLKTHFPLYLLSFISFSKWVDLLIIEILPRFYPQSLLMVFPFKILDIVIYLRLVIASFSCYMKLFQCWCKPFQLNRVCIHVYDKLFYSLSIRFNHFHLLFLFS